MAKLAVAAVGTAIGGAMGNPHAVNEAALHTQEFTGHETKSLRLPYACNICCMRAGADRLEVSKVVTTSELGAILGGPIMSDEKLNLVFRVCRDCQEHKLFAASAIRISGYARKHGSAPGEPKTWSLTLGFINEKVAAQFVNLNRHAHAQYGKTSAKAGPDLRQEIPKNLHEEHNLPAEPEPPRYDTISRGGEPPSTPLSEADGQLSGPPDGKQLTAKRDLKRLIKAVGHADSDVSAQTVQSLKELGDAAIGPLLDRLRSPDERTRTSASAVLDRLEWKPQDDEEHVWSLIAKQDWVALVQMDADAVPPLVRIMRDPSSDKGLRIAVVICLAAMASPAAVSTLAATPDGLTELSALALGLSGGSDEAIRALTKVMTSGAADKVKIQASHYLAWCGPTAFDALADVITTGDGDAPGYALLALSVTADPRVPAKLESLRLESLRPPEVGP